MGRKRGVNFQLGNFYRSDDRSGFVRRASETKQEWNQLIVGRDLWEPRQPQDFVKGVIDDQSVPDPRSKLPELFQGPVNTTLSRSASPGDTFLYLSSSGGFSAGDNIGVMTDAGAYFNTSVLGNPTAFGVNIASPMNAYAASGNTVTDYEAPGP